MATTMVPIGEGRTIPVDVRVDVYMKSYVGGREESRKKPHQEMKVNASVAKVSYAQPKVRAVKFE